MQRMKFGTNGVPVARNGLILGQNGATIPTKLFIWLPGLQEVIFEPKFSKNVQRTSKSFKNKISNFQYVHYTGVQNLSLV